MYCDDSLGIICGYKDKHRTRGLANNQLKQPLAKASPLLANEINKQQPHPALHGTLTGVCLSARGEAGGGRRSVIPRSGSNSLKFVSHQSSGSGGCGGGGGGGGDGKRGDHGCPASPPSTRNPRFPLLRLLPLTFASLHQSIGVLPSLAWPRSEQRRCRPPDDTGRAWWSKLFTPCESRPQNRHQAAGEPRWGNRRPTLAAHPSRLHRAWGLRTPLPASRPITPFSSGVSSVSGGTYTLPLNADRRLKRRKS
ncbi:hypothetical protein E2C01_045184 [Portunus trituberculatus]|uniref:Uncharacterized protein n=1 Tax=Portunus trituberculatus TaxID=210409 RepID=A0A5B7FV26_PORTR|nr:hypothetical protein [Portunus trituberculatus]